MDLENKNMEIDSKKIEFWNTIFKTSGVCRFFSNKIRNSI